MNKKEIEQKVKEILAKRLGIPSNKITLDSHLVDDLGMDSFGAVEVMFEMEDRFSINVNEKKLIDIKTVQDMINYIASKLKNP